MGTLPFASTFIVTNLMGCTGLEVCKSLHRVPLAPAPLYDYLHHLTPMEELVLQKKTLESVVSPQTKPCFLNKCYLDGMIHNKRHTEPLPPNVRECVIIHY